MPTGYTASLDEKKKTTKAWFTEDLVRAFGVCVTLREEPSGLTEKEIHAKLMKDMGHDLSYHKKELGKARTKQQKFLKKKKPEWEADAEKERNQRRGDNKRRTNEALVMKTRHALVRNDLTIIVNDPKATEVTRNIAKFGIEQLDAVKRECEPWLQDVGFTWNEYREEKRKDVIRDIDYHIKGLKEAKERWEERFEVLKGVMADIERIFNY